MAFDFKKSAQKVTSLSPIMVGKEKLETEDIVGQVLTVVAFDFAPKFDKDGNPVVNPVTGEADTFGVVIFKEKPTSYYCVGTVFTKVCKAWDAEFGSAEEASAELEASGGVKVKFSMGKTRNGKNNLVSVEILE